MIARRNALRFAAILGLTLAAGAAHAQSGGVTGVPALDQLLPAGNGAASAGSCNSSRCSPSCPWRRVCS